MLCFALGSAYLVSGVIPKVFGETATAEAAAKQYTSEWKATRMLKVQWGGCTSAGSCSNSDYVYSGAANPYWPKWLNSFQESALVGRSVSVGVAEWEVKGQVPANGTYFKESWAIPGSRNLDVRFENDTSGVRQIGSVSPTTVNLGDFSIGISDYASALRFITAPVLANNNPKPSNWTNFSNGSSTCFSPGTGYNEIGQCISSTGSYGWARSFIGDSAPFGNELEIEKTGAVYGFGNFMPLKWTVTGYVCDQASDVQCR